MSNANIGAAQLDEMALVKRVAWGDEDAVETLYRTFADAVFAFIYRRIDQHKEDAEELTLDTFLAASTAARGFRGKCVVLTWLCAIARQKIADHLRKSGAQKRQLAEMSAEDVGRLFASASGAWRSSDADAILDRLEANALAATLLDLLSEDEREAILLRYYDEFSVREIAQLLGRSEKGVESLLDRAKRRQRSALAGWIRAGLTEGGAA